MLRRTDRRFCAPFACGGGGEKARKAEPATAPASAATNTVSVTFSARVDVEVSCFGDPPRVPVVTDLRFMEPGTKQLTDIAPGFCNITRGAAALGAVDLLLHRRGVEVRRESGGDPMHT